MNKNYITTIFYIILLLFFDLVVLAEITAIALLFNILMNGVGKNEK